MTRETMKKKIEEIKAAIESYEADFECYGIRFHRGDSVEIGSDVPCSFRWEDGEMTEEELDGTSALDLTYSAVDRLIEMVKIYCYGEGEVIIIAGNHGEYGEDTGEIVIEKAIRVA